MWSTAERRTAISLSPPSPPRLRLEPTGSSRTPLARTLLDGGWWPRSADPVVELPGLILALDHRHGPVTHVMLRRDDWDSHPRRLRIDAPDSDAPGSGGPAAGRVVRLGWFDTLPIGLLTAICAGGQRIDLLTVPPHTGEAVAQAAMELAAHPGNILHTPDILSATTTRAPRAEQPEAQPETGTAPEDTWESEGGRLNDHTAGSGNPRPEPARTRPLPSGRPTPRPSRP